MLEWLWTKKEKLGKDFIKTIVPLIKVYALKSPESSASKLALRLENILVHAQVK